MTACVFSSPQAASPECSTEVSPSTLVPSHPPVAGELPATGGDAGGLLLAAAILISVGLLVGLPGWTARKIDRDWRNPR